MSRRVSIGAIIAIAVLLLVVLLMDVAFMFGSLQRQARDAGISQLEDISRELDSSIVAAELLAMEVAVESDAVLDDRSALESFLYSKKAEIVKGNSGAFNVYAAGDNWWIIPDFDSPDDYVAQERTWYKGAIRNGGTVYVTSPYQDAMTGDICYTVSVMLADGKTVVAVDYTMDINQSFVEQMYDKGTHNAVIVTDDGIIAGCADESLLGTRLESALPEFTGIWSLSKRSDEFVTAHVGSGLQYESLFATKTGNGWILIVSVSDWELYRALYIQLFLTVILLVALFVTVILTLVFARRSQKRAGEDTLQRRKRRKEKEVRGVNRRYRNRILVFMIVTMVFSFYAIVSSAYNWGSVQMQNEAKSYEQTLSKWFDTQKSVLDMFASIVSTNPGMLDDYEGTIAYLDGITNQFPDISASYMASLNHEPQVFMNNGWMPGEGVSTEDRPWYIGSMEASSGWCITTPYFDEQTGGYCVTMAKQVHDAKTGEFLGVFGIDFYMDTLVGIMGNSFGDKGYAFLVDTEGYIINHPYGKYQMSADNQTSVLELPYGTVKADGRDMAIIQDYDGTQKVVLATVDDESRFSVYVVSDALLIYGNVLLYGSICLVAFLVCIILVFRILSQMISWQNEVNRRLEKAAQTDSMTGLLNKASAEETISRAVKQGTGALLVVDLDNFKLVNDLYSHEMGDRILVRFATLIQSVIRDDDIAGRIGGDEFAVFCEGLVDESTIKRKAGYLNVEIARSAREYLGDDAEIPLGCSTGVAIAPREGREYSVLFAKADLALHQAKRNGKHDVKIFRDEETGRSKSSAGDLANLQMIFGERNVRKTALVADRELFQEIYRYMVRLTSVTGWNLHLVEFTLRAKGEGDLSNCVDRFIEISADLLRNCDVILKYNDSQVVLLLLEPEGGSSKIPVGRILNAWEQEGVPEVALSYQVSSADAIA